jgi:hypothetical protein
LTEQNPYVFLLMVNGNLVPIGCDIPSKGKGEFCEDGAKFDDCVEIGPQDTVAVAAFPGGLKPTGETAGINGNFPGVQASWVAKLDIGGECLD